MAPTMKNGSVPPATASGSGWSGDSCDRSFSQAKKRTNGRRLRVAGSRMVPSEGRVAGLERVDDRSLGGLADDLQFHLVLGVSERPQVSGEHDADHGSV